MYADSDHNESIYNIVPPKYMEQQKPPMYRSTHNGTIPPTSSTFHAKTNTTKPATSNLDGKAQTKVCADNSHAHFGKAPGSYTNEPQAYMKKFANTASVPSLAEVRRTNPSLLKPHDLKPSTKKGGPPKQEDVPVMNLVTSKNFIVANAVETILAAPKKVTQGAKDYLQKEDYGKVPKYLTHIKKDIEAEYDYIRTLEQHNHEMFAPQIRGLDEEERLQMIDALKGKWEQVNTQYQAGTHITKLDTMGKMKRKEMHEAELAQIEKDIEKLSKRNIAIDMTA